MSSTYSISSSEGPCPSAHSERQATRRSSAACTSCRNKKQKCDGDRSGCSQCESIHIPCTWPEQRKRGPAKEYLDGLSNRVYEAEAVLLKLLPLVSAEQLKLATSNLSAHKANNLCDLQASDGAWGEPGNIRANVSLRGRIECLQELPLNRVQKLQMDFEGQWQGVTSLEQVEYKTSPTESISPMGSPRHTSPLPYSVMTVASTQYTPLSSGTPEALPDGPLASVSRTARTTGSSYGYMNQIHLPSAPCQTSANDGMVESYHRQHMRHSSSPSSSVPQALSQSYYHPSQGSASIPNLTACSPSSENVVPCWNGYPERQLNSQQLDMGASLEMEPDIDVAGWANAMVFR